MLRVVEAQRVNPVQVTSPSPDNLQPLDFNALLDSYDYIPPERGQILDSIVLHKSDHEIILDVGLKRDAIVPRQDIERLDQDTLNRLSRGSQVKAWVLQPYSYDGELIVSINKALQLEDWQRAQAMLDSGEADEVEVVGQNRGGLLVQFGRLRGFIPNSHTSSLRRTTPADQMHMVKEHLYGQTLRATVIEIDRRRDRLVLSEREAMQTVRLQRLLELQVGQEISGIVTQIVNFGAFVDLGGVDGLIHISRLAHRYVEHPGDEVHVGQEVTVLVTGVDIERERISLDRRSLLPDPWETFAARFHVDDLIEGTVTKVTPYGIFVNVAGGVQGLVHLSNMTQFDVTDPADAFSHGNAVLARIVEIDDDRQRIALSTDAVTVAEQEQWMQERLEQSPA